MYKEQVDKLKKEYENKGYCKIQNFFTFSEIERIKRTLENAKNKSNVSKEKVPLKLSKNDYIDTTDHAYDLVRYDFVSSLIKKKLPFLNYITGKKIMIMHNALFSLEPNQTGLSWHVGIGSFSFTKTEDFGASIWIPLDEITKEYRGGVQYVSTKIFPGQFYYTINDLHLKNNIKWDESKGDLNEYVANANTILNKITEDVIDYTIQDGYEEHEYNVGDVLFFNKYVLHKSVPLKPGLHKLRRAFVIRLVDYDTRVDEERLGLFSKYSQLHSRVYKTLPRYTKDSVLVMVLRAIQQGLKSPYLRDIPYIQTTLSERIAVESENFDQTLTIQPLDTLNGDVAQIKENLKESLAEVLYSDISEIQEEQNFLELGLDSIVGVEWITTINNTYELDIKASKLYDYPTLLELAEYIAKVLLNNEKTTDDIKTSSQKLEISNPFLVEDDRLKNRKDTESTEKINQEVSVILEQEGSKLNDSLSPKVNLSEIIQVLKQQLASVLYLEVNEIQEEQNFLELGLDSIVGVEWITTINNTYELDIKASKLYDYPTLLELAEYIAGKILDKNGKFCIRINDSTRKKPSDIHPQENYRQKLRSILNQVVNHELTIQAANQMIKQLKQNSTIQDEPTTKNKIFEMVRKHTHEVVPELKGAPIEMTDSLKNLGIDSVNRAEIIMMVMEELDLHIPLIELAPARNIGEIADLFAAKLEAHHEI